MKYHYRLINDLKSYLRYFRGKIVFPFLLEIVIFLVDLLPKNGNIRKESSKECEEKGNQLDLIPYYERHYWKHVVTGFKIDPIEEIKMQAFQFGNVGFMGRNVLLFLLFVPFAPEVWIDIPQWYKRGKRIRTLAFHLYKESLNINLQEFRREMEL